jgi:hypothetical protein
MARTQEIERILFEICGLFVWVHGKPLHVWGSGRLMGLKFRAGHACWWDVNSDDVTDGF